MPLILEVKNGKDGQRKPVYANHYKTLQSCIEIIDKEQGQKGAWGSMTKPHVVKGKYKWELIFADNPDDPAWVGVEPGDTIHIWRQV